MDVCVLVYVCMYVFTYVYCIFLSIQTHPTLPVRICVTVDILPLGSEGFSLSEETLTVAYEAMLTAMQDYTTDSRGDVGAL